MERKWWKESVVYQIYPRSFKDSNGDGIGDIPGIIEKLPYLQELGVDVLWISPVLESPGDDNGYDISDYYQILREFGTMEEYELLLKEAHRRGLKILMDLALNHTSDEHVWFVESKKSPENPYRDYYIWRPAQNGREPNNWGACFGGSAWEYDAGTSMYYLHSFSRKQPDLNWENEQVRRELYRMMDWWCQKGIDGFRLDVISMISKDQRFLDGEKKNGLYGDSEPYCFNGPRVHEFLQEMNREVLSHYDLMTVGETPGVTVAEAKKYAGKDTKELDLVFQFEHVESGNGSLGKWTTKRFDLMELKEILAKWQTELAGWAWNSIFWGNHDQPRAVSRFGNDSPQYRTLSAKMLATCQMSLQGTPFIYQGEELGMMNAYFENLDCYQDIESIRCYHEFTEAGLISEQEMLECLKCRARDNARTPMSWDVGPNAGFTTGKPWMAMNPNDAGFEVERQQEDADSVLQYYRRMIQIRKQEPGLIYGDFIWVEPAHPQIFAYERRLVSDNGVCAEENSTYLVACNFTAEKAELTVPAGYETGARCLIANYQEREDVWNGSAKVQMQPYEAWILKK